MLGVRVPPGLPVSDRRSGCQIRDGRLHECGAVHMKEFFEKVMGWFRNIFDFFKDTRKELNNVSWPGRREVMGTTIVVIVAVFFFGFFLYIVDLIVGNGMNHLFRALTAQN
jgi:preprotein translocase subunit SecE